MIPKGTRKPLTDTVEECHGWCFIPSWNFGSSGCGNQDNARKKRKLMGPNHQSNKLERLLFEELRQCDVCGKNILYKPKRCEEGSVAEALPKFIEKHITCQNPLPCRWCDETSDNNKKYPCCDSLFCSDKCRNLAECAFYNDRKRKAEYQTQSTTFSGKNILMPPPKLFFCRNRFHKKHSNINDDIDDDLCKEAAQSLVAIEKKFKILCGNNLRLEECALMLSTILSVLSPSWIDILNGDEQKDGSDYEVSLTEELWTMARSHWSVAMLLQSNERTDDAQKRQFMPYDVFCQTYLCIKRQCLSQVALPDHPLMTYARKTLLSAEELTDAERDLALNILQHPCIPVSRQTQSKASDIEQQSIIQWRNAAHTAHWLSNFASLEEGRGVSQIQSHLGRTYFVFAPLVFGKKMQHSCCPAATLDVQDPCSPLESISWLSLHDVEEEEHLSSYSALDYSEGNVRARAADLQKLFGSHFKCSCDRCLYETSNTHHLNQLQLKNLADLAMQQGRYSDAFQLYESIIKFQPRGGNNIVQADVLHARAAAALGIASTSFGDKGHCDGHFILAQSLWKEAGSKCGDHPEISLHVDKQRVFRTIDWLDENEAVEVISSTSNIKYSTFLGGKCFITNKATPLLSESECQFVIDTAEKHCESSSGWTTTRHYAVPTTDIPIHEITKLHDFFTKKLWFDRIRPLLRKQLKLLSSSRQIFIHDAFVVRYDSSKQRYLPPHMDESSHSFVIALNSEFHGGGTYIHELGYVLSPAVGGMVSFSGGSLLHSGDPVISGTRYCVVGFCYIDKVGDKTETDGMGKDTETAPFSFGFQFD